MSYFVDDTDSLEVNRELTLDDKIKHWRVTCGRMLLLSKYDTLGELEKDYLDFNLMHRDNQRISDFKSFELFSMSNETRYRKMKSDFLKVDIKDDIHDDIYIPRLLSEELEWVKNFDNSSLNAFRDHHSKIATGIWVPLEDPVELCLYRYKDIELQQLALSSIGNAGKHKLFKSTVSDNKAKQFFKDKLWGIVISSDKRGYIYCKDTNRYYEYSHKAIPIINYTKPFKFDEMILREKIYYGIAEPTDSVNELMDYAMTSDILTESIVADMDGIKGTLLEDILLEDIFDKKSDANRIPVTRDVPYFTPYEMDRLGISYYDKNCYQVKPNQTVINEKPIKEWYEEYKARFAGYNNMSFTPGFVWRRAIHELSEKMAEATGDEKLACKQSLLDLGWNPEIPYNEETQKFAKQRISRILNESYSDIDFFQNTGVGISSHLPNDGFKNILVVFSDAYRDGYKNMNVSFDESLEMVYEWDKKNKTFKTTQLKEDINIFCTKIPNVIVETLEANIYKSKPIEISLDENTYCRNLKMITETTIRNILREHNIFPTALSIVNLYEGYAEDYNTLMTESTITIDDLQIGITEVKEFPAQFDEDGNLLISKGRDIDYEAEYAATHLALVSYIKAGNVQGMEYCMCKLWYLNLLVNDEIHRSNTNSTKLKKLHTVRAKIVNDLKTYLPVVLEHDPDFNIQEAYENSPFSDSKVKINKSTIQYTMDMLKSLISLVR